MNATWQLNFQKRKTGSAIHVHSVWITEDKETVTILTNSTFVNKGELHSINTSVDAFIISLEHNGFRRWDKPSED